MSDIKIMGTLVLMGGGLDSSYLAANLAKSNKKNSILGIHFDYGQLASNFEREAVSKIGKHIGIDILYEKFEFPIVAVSHEIKGRNLLLSMASLPFAIKNKCSQIALGIHKGSDYYDTTEHFLENVNVILDGYFGGSIKIIAPLIDLVKSEIYELSRKDIPYDLIYSCESGSYPPCGRCLSCRDRSLIDAYN